MAVPAGVRFDVTRDSVAERIVSHYAIERSLGAGGMGEVFLRDLALGRPVALKLTAPWAWRSSGSVAGRSLRSRAASRDRHLLRGGGGRRRVPRDGVRAG